MTGVVSVLEQLPLPVVLTLAVLLVMGETAVIVGLSFPVEITLMFVGFLAYLGEVPLVLAAVLMIGAAMAGDALALRSGRKYGPRVRASRIGGRIGAERWRRADRILRRLGGRSAFIARWVPFVRTLLPRLAGSAGMPYRQFVGWNAAGVVTAVGSSVALGYLAGASYQRAAHLFGRATTGLLLLLLVLIGIVLAGRWLGRHPEPARAMVGRLAGTAPARWLRRGSGEVPTRWGAGRALVGNLVAGLAILFGFGLALSWLVQLTIEHSGLWRVDAAVGRALAQRQAEPLVAAADLVTTVLRGPVLVLVVAVVAVIMAQRHGYKVQQDLTWVLGTAGAFLPLVVLAAAAEASSRDAVAGPAVPVGVSTEVTVATAAVCTLAWLLTRHARWHRAVTGWTGAMVAVTVLATARLYLGWHTTSETATAVLLGGLWSTVIMIAWAARRQRLAQDEQLASEDDGPPRHSEVGSATGRQPV